jgi:hypothetical protein
MLIQTPAKHGDTISIKLSSGEEMVARYEGQDSNNLMVHKPLMLTATQSGVGLAPYMFTTKDEKFELSLNNIICVAKTDKDMADKYVESTTGLKIN